MTRHNISRRNFLKSIPVYAIGSSLVSCTHRNFFNPDEDIFLSGGSFGDKAAIKNALVIINIAQQKKKVVETPFLPHGININPTNKYSIFCFEKNGRYACEIDLKTQSVVRTLHSEDNQLFSGHACFSRNGKFIYCIESNKDNLQGNITVRDSKTFEVTQQLPTLGLSPHHCHLSKEELLTISNTGKSESGFHQPSLVSLDLKTAKLVERIKLNEENLNCGHFRITNNNDLIITSAPIDINDKTLSGGVSIRHNNKPITTMTEPDVVIKRMTGEALSIEVNEQFSIAAVTHPEANLITFWSIKDKKIIKAYGFENPRGISLTLDKKYFMISYGHRPAMVKISIEDFTPLPDSLVQPTLSTGEHIINWSLTLRDIMPKQVYS